MIQTKKNLKKLGKTCDARRVSGDCQMGHHDYFSTPFRLQKLTHTKNLQKKMIQTKKNLKKLGKTCDALRVSGDCQMGHHDYFSTPFRLQKLTHTKNLQKHGKKTFDVRGVSGDPQMGPLKR